MIKGEGDVKVVMIVVDVFGCDLQFYQFYVSLQVYWNMFKCNDIIVVDFDSEFFCFMCSLMGGVVLVVFVFCKY